jgi:hypothetical protein
MQGENTLAYLFKASVTKQRVFTNVETRTANQRDFLTNPVTNVINLFMAVIYKRL